MNGNEIKYYPFSVAYEKLVNGDCEAIRPKCNKVVCAYYDKDGGELRKATIRKLYFPTEIVGTEIKGDKFLLHEEYFIEDEWELVIDEARRHLIDNKLKNIYQNCRWLNSLNHISKEDMNKVFNIINKDGKRGKNNE